MDSSDSDIDRCQLLQMFPTEIWNIILKLVESNEDNETVSNSSSFFRNILHQKRVLFLFPKVFENVADNLFLEQGLNLVQNRYFRATSLSKRWYSDLLRCRLVCRSWNADADQYFENFVASDTLQALCCKYPKKLSMSELCSWMDENFICEREEYYHKIAKTIHHFLPTHASSDCQRSPFLTRQITLDLRFCHDNEEETGYYESFEQLFLMLIAFGEQVWHCKLYPAESEEIFEDNFLRTRGVLSLMPNLKHLGLIMSHNGAELQSQEITNTVMEYELPTFAHLESLTLTSIPGAIFRNLLLKNSHITTLHVHSTPFLLTTGIQYFYEYLPALPYLTSLHLPHAGEHELRNLLRTPKANWPLRKWYLNILADKFEHITDLFRFIGYKYRTLETLHISIIPENCFKARKNLSEIRVLPQLKCENLEHISVETIFRFSCDFFLPMKETIKRLEIRINRLGEPNLEQEISDVNTEMGNEIKFWEYLASPLKSNIWAEIENLEWLKYTKTCNSAKALEFTYMRRDWKLASKSSIINSKLE